MSHVTASGLPYVWRTRLPERRGQRCRITPRGGLNNVRDELADGFWLVIARWAGRRAR